jgi:hypothetical protein
MKAQLSSETRRASSYGTSYVYIKTIKQEMDLGLNTILYTDRDVVNTNYCSQHSIVERA